MRDHFESLGKIVRNSKRKPPFRRAALGHLPEILLYKFIRIAFEPLLSLLICEWKNINFVIPARRRILSPQKESTVAGALAAVEYVSAIFRTCRQLPQRNCRQTCRPRNYHRRLRPSCNMSLPEASPRTALCDPENRPEECAPIT